MSKNAPNKAAIALTAALSIPAAALANGDASGPAIADSSATATTGPAIADSSATATTGPVSATTGPVSGTNTGIVDGTFNNNPSNTNTGIVDGTFNNNPSNTNTGTFSNTNFVSQQQQQDQQQQQRQDQANNQELHDSGNSTNNNTLAPTQNQNASTNGTNTLNDNRVTKYQAAPNNTAPAALGNGTICDKRLSAGFSIVGGVGAGIGGGKTDIKCLEKVHGHEERIQAGETDRAVTLQIIEKGGAIGTVYGMRKQAETNAPAARAFNGTADAVREYKVREDSKGPKKEPSLSDLMAAGAHVEIPTRAAAHANGRTGQEVQLVSKPAAAPAAPAPSFGGDK